MDTPASRRDAAPLGLFGIAAAILTGAWLGLGRRSPRAPVPALGQTDGVAAASRLDLAPPVSPPAAGPAPAPAPAAPPEAAAPIAAHAEPAEPVPAPAHAAVALPPPSVALPTEEPADARAPLTDLGMRVVEALRGKEPLRKAEVARLVGIGRGSANRIVDRLVDGGWVHCHGDGLYALA